MTRQLGVIHKASIWIVCIVMGSQEDKHATDRREKDQGS